MTKSRKVAVNAPGISIVIPLFNERDGLGILNREIAEAMRQGSSGYEVIFVDDGSSDDSVSELRSLKTRYPEIRILRHRENYGQSAALFTGFEAARGDVVVTLDGDLQNDPADIPLVLAALEGCDLVSGVRRMRHDAWHRRVSSRIAKRTCSWFLGDPVRDVGCSLKAYRREILDRLPFFDGVHRFLPTLVQMKGGRIRDVEVGHRPRVHGSSSYGISNRLFRGLLDLAGVYWLKHRTRKIDVDEVAENVPVIALAAATPHRPDRNAAPAPEEKRAASGSAAS